MQVYVHFSMFKSMYQTNMGDKKSQQYIFFEVDRNIKDGNA